MAATISLSAGAQFGLDQLEGEVRERAENELDTLVNGGLDAMGLGDVPIQIDISDISPEGIRDATINGGIQYAENQLEALVGYPVPLPRKLTLSGLQNAIGSVIPTDFWGAVDFALVTAGQAVAGVVTSLLVGAGVGSVIPGLGTIVGVGVALGIASLKSLLAEDPRRKIARVCNTLTAPDVSWATDTGIAYRPANMWESGCMMPSPEQTPLNVLVDGMRFQTRLASQIVEEIRVDGYCEGGPSRDCSWFWVKMINESAELSRGTPEKMTKPEVAEVLPGFEAAPTAYIYFDPVTSTIKQHHYSNVIVGLLAQLRTRSQQLLRLDQGIHILRNLDIHGVRALQMELMAEVGKAAVAVQSSYGVRPVAIVQANAAELVRLSNALQAANARLIELGVALQSSTYVPPPAPAAVPALAACSQLYDAWARAEPHRALCVDGDTKSVLIGLCLQARAGTITLERMTAQADLVVDEACKRHSKGQIWAAFQRGAYLGLNPVARAIAARV